MQAYAAVEDLKSQLSREKKISEDLQIRNGDLCRLTSQLRADLSSMESRFNAVMSEEQSSVMQEHQRVVNDLRVQHTLALSELTATHDKEKRVTFSQIEDLEHQLEAT